MQALQYDALGRRIVQQVQNSADLDRTEHYYHAGESVVEVRNGSGLLLKQQLWAGTFGMPGGYIDQLLQLAVNADPFATDGSEDVCEGLFYALHDANYNLLALVDDEGAVAERYEYTPYGQRTVYFSPGPNDPLAMAPTTMSRRWQVDGVSQPYGLNTIGHQGLSHDAVTGLVHNRARMLHPRLGRFMQRDPINQSEPGGGYHDGMNLYQYARSNPVGFADPAGLAVFFLSGSRTQRYSRGNPDPQDLPHGGDVSLDSTETARIEVVLGLHNVNKDSDICKSSAELYLTYIADNRADSRQFQVGQNYELHSTINNKTAPLKYFAEGFADGDCIGCGGRATLVGQLHIADLTSFDNEIVSGRVEVRQKSSLPDNQRPQPIQTLDFRIEGICCEEPKALGIVHHRMSLVERNPRYRQGLGYVSLGLRKIYDSHPSRSESAFGFSDPFPAN